MWNESQRQMNAVAFLARARTHGAGSLHGVVREHADGVSVEARESRDQARVVEGLDLEHAPRVEDPREDLVHVVRDLRAGGQDVEDVVEAPSGGVARSSDGRKLVGAVRQVAEHPSNLLHAILLAVGEEIDLSGHLGVELPATDLFPRDDLAGRGGEHRRPRDGHDGALHLDDDVRHGGLPRRPAVALAHDGGDERHAAVSRRAVDRVDHAHHPGGPHDVGDACASAVSEGDERKALLGGVRHRVVVLLDADPAA